MDEKDEESQNSENDQFEKNLFTPRGYQIEMLEIAKDKNTIAWLGTGTGKTFIAVMLIRHYSNQTLGEYDKAKRTLFLVPTVPLVHQQAEVIRKHIDLNVGEYFGEKETDFNKDKWLKEFQENNILVMVAELFRLIMHHGLLAMCKINLIVIDECHRAVKHHPYREALKCMDVCDIHNRPRILGLTAALINGKCRPYQLEEKIKNLEKNIYCSVATPEDIFNLKRYGTDPIEIISEYQCFRNSHKIFKKLVNFLNSVTEQVSNCIEDDLKNEDIIFFLHPRKALSSITSVFATLGFWSGLCSTKVIISEVEKLLKNELNIKDDLNKLHDILLYVHELCSEMIQETELENLFFCVSPQLVMLLKILYETAGNYDINVNKQEYNLEQCNCFSGIIFVKQRIFAYTICEWLKEVSKNIPKYSFIKVNYIVGHGMQQRTEFSKSTSMTYKKQQAAIKDFRRKKFNILIATSVIEEGLDIPKCNTVIRFDLPDDFRAYVQSKGRARAKEAKYFLMTSYNEKEKFSSNLKDFKDIEKILMKYCHQRTETTVDIPHLIDDDILPPYMPLKEDGAPRITMTSAISLINRYCAKLPCDKTSKLTPHWRIRDVERNYDYFSDIYYECILDLPSNSPLKKTIVSPPMKIKRHARMAAALDACKELHKIGELDEKLLPIGNNIDKYKCDVVDEFDDDKNEKKKGRRKTIRAYKKQVPEILQKSLPTEYVACFLYIVRMKFSSVSSMERVRDVENVEKGTNEYGILTTKQFPTLFKFPVYTSKTAIQIDINIESAKTYLKFSNDQLSAIQIFHQYIFTEILQLNTENIQFDPETAEFSIYIVPIAKKDKYNSCEIDWNMINQICRHVNTEREELIKISKNGINPELYNDVVMYSWLNDLRKKNYFYVNEILYDMTPLSHFSSSEYKNYKEYFYNKYNVEIENESQFLLACGYINNAFCTKLTNRFSDQYGKPLMKTINFEKLTRQSIVTLVPELCIIIPLPCSFFIKILTLPSVLYRLSSFIQADLFRITIAKEANIGLTEFVSDVNWFNFEFNDNYQKKSENLFNVQHVINDKCIMTSAEKIKLGKSEISKINLDYEEDLSNHPGPNPWKILAALTLIRSHDCFNLERLETIGDSFLKYSVSVYLYCNFDLDEGKLTQLKSLIISNYNLYQLAKAKGLEKCIVGQKFDFKRNWLPPCFVFKKKENTNKTNKSTNAKINQNLSDKCIADSVEALIGVYLLNCGVCGALKFMSWLKFKIFDHLSFNSNKLPMKVDKIMPILDLPFNLRYTDYNYLKKFEEKIGYTFRQKLYLLEAFTHPSYYEQEINFSCYQRLEFLGDAVLDYIITRYLYEDPRKHSPGVLTDLRAALVNNYTFAILAVKNDFHKYLQHMSDNLFQVIDRFVTKVMASKNIQNFLNETEEMDIDNVEVPKPLSDMFESVAGAIYIDSNKSLETVWDVYYPMMKPSFDICDNIPKSSIRQLYELCPKNVKFSKSEIMDDGNIKVTVIVNGDNEFEGLGVNKSVARKIAAKKALNFLKKT